MPLYEYHCGQCEKQFEASQSLYARVEDTECPFCRARQATRLMSLFSSNVVGDRKPGFSELKAKAMHEERMRSFAKLPPVNVALNMPPPDAASESDSAPTEGSIS
ncbi:MAG: zinc ribbon domain-containing protein [Nitrospira sp.]|nr:zinc ribbon domain-containing protein [Nitrospira sp.]